jgi:hypothetical protein
LSSTGPMLIASSEPCFGTDRQVASGFRENHAFCAGRPDLLPEWSVKERLKAPARQNPVAQCRPTWQPSPQSAFAWGPSGKCRLSTRALARIINFAERIHEQLHERVHQ